MNVHHGRLGARVAAAAAVLVLGLAGCADDGADTGTDSGSGSGSASE